MTDRFQRAMWLTRRHDPQAREDGYHLLLPYAAEHLDQLVTEFRQESDDHGLSCWLLELIAESGSPAALPVLVEQLHGDDDSLRDIAARGLRSVDTKDARKALWRARANGLI